MNLFCYTPRNCPLLYLSPYVKVSLDGDKAVFSQLMFRTAVRLGGNNADLSECLRLLRGGVRQADFVQWGESRFEGFAAWLGRAMRAGIIE